MNILLVNDDGINSPGLWALSGALARSHVVTVVAPVQNRSAIGHAITLNEPLFVHQADFPHGVEAWSVSGTPVDCTRLGLLNLAPGPVDLVISGPNNGQNAAFDLPYSGTVAAALEAAMLGVKAIALSAPQGTDDQQTVETFMSLFDLLDIEHSFDQVLNINIPNRPIQDVKGVRWAPLGRTPWQDSYECRTSPNGQSYYWLRSAPAQHVPGEPDDWNSLHDGYITLTPLTFRQEQPIEGRKEIPWQ